MKGLKWFAALGILAAGCISAYWVMKHQGWKRVHLIAPAAIAADKAGNVYIADANNYTIDKLTPDGNLSILVGSPGRVGTVGGQAKFFSPSGLALGQDGTLFASDLRNNVIYKVTPDGNMTLLAGSPSRELSFAQLKAQLDSQQPNLRDYRDGDGIEARFSVPHGIAVDGAGVVYVADMGNNVIRKIMPDGTVSTLAGKAGERGNVDGIGADARFSMPDGVALDGAGNVYVTDTGNNIIRKITPDGTVSTLFGKAGEHGYSEGPAADARLRPGFSIASDSSGNLYVLDSDSIRSGRLVMITPDGAVTRLGSAYGESIALDGAGGIYLLSARKIQKVAPNGMLVSLWEEKSFNEGPGGKLVDALPEGRGGMAILAIAAGNILLLVFVVAMVINQLFQVLWKLATKTEPPSVFYLLATLGVAALPGMLSRYAYAVVNPMVLGFDLTAPTLVTLQYHTKLQYLPILVPVLFLPLIKTRRRESHYAKILGVMTVLVLVIAGSWFWPIFVPHAIPE